MGIVYTDITKNGKVITFKIYEDLVDRLRIALQQIGHEMENVCRILPKDNDGNRIEDEANEPVDQIRIDVNENRALSRKQLEELVLKAWYVEYGFKGTVRHDSGSIREW